VLRQPGAREVLFAQTLWVLAYAALPAFFILYAEEALELGVGVAGALPLAFGAFIALGMALAGRARPERVHGLLVTGAALLGSGLLAAALTSRLAAAAVPLATAGLGAGLLTSLGFAYFARFVPDGEAGSYSGVFFAARGVAAAIALPLAGVAVELTDSYRTVLWLGASALVALIPLIAAKRRNGRADGQRPRPVTVAAVIPVFASDRAADVARATLRHVDALVLVDDGAPPEIARSLTPLTNDERARLVTLGHNGGKGTAVAAGIRLALHCGPRPDAIVVLDSDGQHDPGRIPAFVESAQDADIVIGWRRDRSTMPVLRRVANRAASLALLAGARSWVPDTQNGMRLFRSEVLLGVEPPDGGYEAESRHLRALLAKGHRVTSVEIPTIYDGEPSHFRPLVDTIAVGRALLAPPRRDNEAEPRPAPLAMPVLRAWGPRLLASMGAVLALAAVLPALQPLDNQLFLAVNGLGDGPEALYHVFDPHTRNYILLTLAALIAAAVTLRRPRHVIGTGLVVLLAAYLAGAALEVLKLFVDRVRPEEVLGSEVLLSHGRSWSHLASFPSGHMMVTAAMAAAAGAAVPLLRRPLVAYVAMVGFTRVLFGAHFPLDVLVGTALGYELGLFSASLLANARLLPEHPLVRAPEPLPETAPSFSQERQALEMKQ
jgi:dolichol-phosphate mannosyltransferase